MAKQRKIVANKMLEELIGKVITIRPLGLERKVLIEKTIEL